MKDKPLLKKPGDFVIWLNEDGTAHHMDVYVPLMNKDGPMKIDPKTMRKFKTRYDK